MAMNPDNCDSHWRVCQMSHPLTCFILCPKTVQFSSFEVPCRWPASKTFLGNSQVRSVNTSPTSPRDECNDLVKGIGRKNGHAIDTVSTKFLKKMETY